jgi:hypothetical protein
MYRFVSPNMSQLVLQCTPRSRRPKHARVTQSSFWARGVDWDICKIWILGIILLLWLILLISRGVQIAAKKGLKVLAIDK